MRLTALGATAAERARRILNEYEDAERWIDAARAGRTGAFRVTANSTWNEAVLARTTARFHAVFPAIELSLETAIPGTHCRAPPRRTHATVAPCRSILRQGAPGLPACRLHQGTDNIRVEMHGGTGSEPLVTVKS